MISYRTLYIAQEDYDKSQMAAAYHRSIGGIADSAGITVPRRKLELTLNDIPEAENTIKVMKEIGVDISGVRPRLLTLDLFGTFDRAICMEIKNCPDYLINNHKVIYWDIISDVGGNDFEAMQKMRDAIKRKIDEMVKTW